MVGFSYNVSPKLELYLQRIERLRTRLLLFPLSLNAEISYRFEQTVNRTYYACLLAGKELERSEVKAYLLDDAKKKARHKGIISFKEAMDYIAHEWLVTRKQFNSEEVVRLCTMAALKKDRVESFEFKQFLDFVTVSTENPVTQAGIARIQVVKITEDELLAELISMLLLYKAGYDVRGFLCVGRQLYKDHTQYRDQIQTFRDNSNVTLWLEYYAQMFIRELALALEEITGSSAQSLSQLNERQRHILIYLDNPHVRLTNRKVQALCNVSQVTAARDLAHLRSLGILFGHGKGRSVYYTKV